MNFRHRLLFLLGIFLVFPAAAQTPTRYNAPDNRFSVPIPDGWTLESVDDTGVFTSPEGGQVIWVEVAAQDADSASQTAIEEFLPDFTGTPLVRDEFPATGGIWVQQVYVNFITGKIVVTLTLHTGESAYIAMVAPTDEPTIEIITPALISMLVGFSYKSDIDISGLQALRLDAPMIDELDAYIADALQRFDVPGAAVGIVQNGEIIFIHGYGITDSETSTPIKTDTRFMIGSVSKSMTALLFAQLVDDGLFSWDTPVVDVFPNFALMDEAQTAEIIMRDLLSMSTGLPRYDLPIFLQVMTPQALMADIATYPLLHKNGEAYHYNNQIVAAGGFIAAVLSGYALEDAGDGYADLLEARLFEPANMPNTTVNFDEALASGKTAIPHYYDMVTGDYLPVPYDYERFVVPVAPAGGVWSTIEDMTRYMLVQLGDGTLPDGTQIVSAENLTVTHTGVVDIGNGSRYALGWIDGTLFGQRLLQHDGATAGFSTTFAFLPDVELGIVVLTNRAGSTLGDAIRDYTVELAFGLEHKADAMHDATADGLAGFFAGLHEQENISLDPVEAEMVTVFLGEYERGIRLWLADDRTLMLSGGLGDAPLYAAGLPDSNTFIMGGVLGGIKVQFSEDEGEISLSLNSLLAALSETAPPLILAKIEQ